MSGEALTAGSLALAERLGPSEIVIAVTACTTAEEINSVASALHGAGLCTPSLRSVIVHPNAVQTEAVVALRGQDAALQLLPSAMPIIGRLPFAATDRRDLFRPLSAIAATVGARACALIGAQAGGITPDVVRTLVQPILSQRIDLLLPSYPRHRLDGLINSGVVYPLTRALYGKRVDGQIGIDFGFSPTFLAGVAQRTSPQWNARPLWLLTEAASQGAAIGQAHLRSWRPPAEPATDLSTALALVLGPLFEDMEFHAPIWQRSRGSEPVATFGGAVRHPDEPREVDVRPMIESFQIGQRNLREVWARLLPPATLIELNRLARQPGDRFHLPEALWARIVFDFSLAHRLRVMSRQHLLGALTPLYLAWLASFVLEIGAADSAAAGEALERLCLAYETEKPYLLARWRWPDRFNP